MSWLKDVSFVVLLMLISVNAIFGFVISNTNYGSFISIDTDTEFSVNSISSALSSINFELGNIISSSEIGNFFGFGSATLALMGNFVFKLLPAMAFGWIPIIQSITEPLGLGGLGLALTGILLGLQAIAIFYVIIDIKNALRL